MVACSFMNTDCAKQWKPILSLYGVCSQESASGIAAQRPGPLPSPGFRSPKQLDKFYQNTNEYSKNLNLVILILE